MGADGSIIIDTRIDTKNLDAGVVSTEKALKRLKTSVDETGKSINTAFSAKNAEGLSNSVSEESEKIKAILENTEKSAKSKAAQIAAIYRKQGMSQSDAFKKAWEQIERTSDTGSKKVKKHLLSISNTSNRVVSAFKRIGAVIGTVFAVKEIIQFGAEASRAAREASDSMMGLRSILEGQGRSFSDAKKFIDEYIQDGLIPATDATAAYKNLASRGYDDTQIQQVMTALKDASAYGRQASYSMGEAVKSATEGLKNENSVLVDNAGVTKNVAKMWEDYARSIGTTSQNLTQQQKIQAEVSGILAETRFQTGDAARVASTLTGEIQRLSFGFNNFKIAVGNIVNPILKTFLPVINAALNAVTRFANAIATFVNNFFGTEMNMMSSAAENVSSAVDTSAASTENLAGATEDAAKATKKAQKANKSYLSGLDDIKRFTSDKNTAAGSSGVSTPSTSGNVSSGLSTLPQKTNSVLNQVESGFSKFANKIRSYIEPLVEPVKKFVGIVGDSLKWFYDEILAPLGSWTVNEVLPEFFETLGIVLEFVNEILDAVKPKFKWLWDKVLEPVAKWTGDKFIKSWDLINKALRKFLDWIKELPDWGETADWLKKKWNDAGKYLDKVWKDMKSSAEKSWNNIKNFFKNTWEGIKNNASSFASNVKNTVTNAWSNIKSSTSSAWSGIKSTASSVWNSMKTTASSSFSGIKTTVNNAWASIQQKATGSWSNISTKIVGVLTNISTKASQMGANVKSAFVNAFNGLVNLIKRPVNGVIGFINGMIRGVVNGINAILRAFNSLKVNIPSWVPGYGGRSLGFNFRMLTAPQIPYLAKGAVIPPNAPFMAMLGDQKRGTNIEAPLSTIEEALENVLAKRGISGGNNGGNYRFTAQINRRTLFDELIDEAKMRQMRTGRNPFEMA